MELTKKEFLEIFYYTPKYYKELTKYASKYTDTRYTDSCPFCNIKKEHKDEIDSLLSQKEEVVSTLHNYIYKFSLKDKVWTDRALSTIGPDMLLPENISLELSDEELDNIFNTLEKAYKLFDCVIRMVGAKSWVPASIMPNDLEFQIQSFTIMIATNCSEAETLEQKGFFKALGNFNASINNSLKILENRKSEDSWGWVLKSPNINFLLETKDFYKYLTDILRKLYNQEPKLDDASLSELSDIYSSVYALLEKYYYYISVVFDYPYEKVKVDIWNPSSSLYTFRSIDYVYHRFGNIGIDFVVDYVSLPRIELNKIIKSMEKFLNIPYYDIFYKYCYYEDYEDTLAYCVNNNIVAPVGWTIEELINPFKLYHNQGNSFLSMISDPFKLDRDELVLNITEPDVLRDMIKDKKIFLWKI